MAGDGDRCMPLRGAQGDAGEHSTSAALQPGLQAGLVPAPDNRSHGTRGPVRGQESGTLGSAGGESPAGPWEGSAGSWAALP